MNIQLLPHSCKKLGLLLFVVSSLPGAITGAVYAHHDFYSENFGMHFSPFKLVSDHAMWVLDILAIVGIAIYALSKDKIFDELFQKLRLEALQLTFFLTVICVLLSYIFSRDYFMRPSYLINLQLLAFVLIYYYKKKTITSSN